MVVWGGGLGGGRRGRRTAAGKRQSGRAERDERCGSGGQATSSFPSTECLQGTGGVRTAHPGGVGGRTSSSSAVATAGVARAAARRGPACVPAPGASSAPVKRRTEDRG